MKNRKLCIKKKKTEDKKKMLNYVFSFRFRFEILALFSGLKKIRLLLPWLKI